MSDFPGHSNPRRVLIPWGTSRAYAPSGTGILVSGRGCITYAQSFETTGSAGGGATLFDGTSSNGQQIIDYTLTQGESTSEILGLHWLQFTEGLYVVTNSGSVAGSVTAWVDHDCAAYNGAMYRQVMLAQMELELRLAEIAKENSVTTPQRS